MKRKKERVAACMVLETASLTGYCRKMESDVSLLIQQLKRQNRYLEDYVDHTDSSGIIAHRQYFPLVATRRCSGSASQSFKVSYLDKLACSQPYGAGPNRLSGARQVLSF